ncbi:MAG TPA: beta-N-acetylhexosaminidase, partial [Candidatus Latescibacteria bacterium]|nr:beta-N-acetylhexosaminidase [Candidatus Latescibacterota bacterium]
MVLKDMIGQMVWVGFHGTEPSEDVERLICDHRVGGVVLFSRNVRTPKQVRELTDSLRELAERSGHELPLVVAVDQEGGGVSCLRDGFTRFPPPMAMGATGSLEVVRKAFGVIGRELRTVGVGVDFAPVLDVNTNPENPIIGTRSFGDDPELVAKLGEEAVRGLQDEGVVATAKHFPGHGDTSLDTHLALPRVGHSTERLRKVELLPFSKAVDAGVRAVMTTHIVFEALDPELPATVSPKVLTDLLRGEMGFDGVVVTDCLEMKAMERFWPEVPLMALLAGADVVLISHTYELQVEALKLLGKAVEEGRLRIEA